MVRATTLEMGRAKLLVLAIAALLLASMAMVVTSVARPAAVLAGGECQSSVDHGNGVLDVVLSPAAIYLENGVYYDAATGGNVVTSVTYTINRPTNYDGTNGVWCLTVDGAEVDLGSYSNLPYTSTFAASNFALGQEVCLQSRLPRASGNPKGDACFTVAAHTTASASPSSSASASPSVSPTSSVEAATAPPTDSLAASRGSSSPALGLLLLLLAAIVGGAGLLTPRFRRR